MTIEELEEDLENELIKTAEELIKSVERLEEKYNQVPNKVERKDVIV